METDALRADIENLRRALEHRDVIGQAKGRLMERHDIDADEAFEMLRLVSQHTNIKLHLVASQIAGAEQIDRGCTASGDEPQHDGHGDDVFAHLLWRQGRPPG